MTGPGLQVISAALMALAFGYVAALIIDGLGRWLANRRSAKP